MLHAVNTNKTRLRTLFGDGERATSEDLLTSTVFGPLCFVSPRDRKAIVEELLASVGLSLPVETPSLAFWPRRGGDLHSFRKAYVEPDFVLELGDDASLIVEVKWGAPLGDQELSAQWSSLSSAKRRISGHLLLVREPKNYGPAVESDRKALTAAGINDWPIRILSWRQLADVLSRVILLETISPEGRAWAVEVHTLLAREELRVFQGWLRIEDIGSVSWRVAPEKDCSCFRIPSVEVCGWHVTHEDS